MSYWKYSVIALLSALSSSFDIYSVDGLASGGVATITLERTNSGGIQNGPKVETVDLGQDKLVSLFVPLNDDTSGNSSSSKKRRFKLSKSKSSGRKKCANLAMARFIAHSKIIDDHDVMELGCGLGLISAAATKHARPSHVALTDIDATILAKAYSSCTQLNRSKASISRCVMDWEDKSTWPKQNYDVLLAADILDDNESVYPLIDVLQYYLLDAGRSEKQKRAIIIDPVNRFNRDTFCYAARRAGLEADQLPFPGMEEDFVLLSVTPR